MQQPDQKARGRAFQSLHAGGTFVIANAWDGGSARVLSGLGFQAIATSSGACAATYGRHDGRVSRQEALEHARIICAATPLPVSADLEKGFADQPADVARIIPLAAEAGLVGASIEDFSGDPQSGIFDPVLAAERISAAADAARTLSFPFTLTARAENHLHGVNDLDDTIRRLQAYERAGADVLFAPGLPDLAAVRTVCQSLSKPVNFMVAIPGRSFSVAELAEAGVRRISLATTLYRAAMTGLAAAAREIQGSGSFGYVEKIMSGSEFAGFLER